MRRPVWLLATLLVIGCGSPATETSAPGGGAAPAGSESKADGSGSKPAGSAAMAVDAELTPVVFNATGAPIVEIEAPGMHCEMCAASIVKALKDQPGVVDLKADAETKLVSLAVAKTEFDAEAAVAAIDEAGFGEASLVGAEDKPEQDPS